MTDLALSPTTPGSDVEAVRVRAMGPDDATRSPLGFVLAVGAVGVMGIALMGADPGLGGAVLAAAAVAAVVAGIVAVARPGDPALVPVELVARGEGLTVAPVRPGEGRSPRVLPWDRVAVLDPREDGTVRLVWPDGYADVAADPAREAFLAAVLHRLPPAPASPGESDGEAGSAIRGTSPDETRRSNILALGLFVAVVLVLLVVAWTSQGTVALLAAGAIAGVTIGVVKEARRTAVDEVELAVHGAGLLVTVLPRAGRAPPRPLLVPWENVYPPLPASEESQRIAWRMPFGHADLPPGSASEGFAAAVAAQATRPDVRSARGGKDAQAERVALRWRRQAGVISALLLVWGAYRIVRDGWEGWRSIEGMLLPASLFLAFVLHEVAHRRSRRGS